MGARRKPLPASSFSQCLARSLPGVQGGLWGARATICWRRHSWAQHQPSLRDPSPAFGSCLGWGSPGLGWVTSQLCLQPLRGLCFCLSPGPSLLLGGGPAVLQNQRFTLPGPCQHLAKPAPPRGPVPLASMAACLSHQGHGPRVGPRLCQLCHFSLTRLETSRRIAILESVKGGRR